MISTEGSPVFRLLTQISMERPSTTEAPQPARAVARASEFARPRQLSPLEAARLRKRLGELVPASAVADVFRQVLWSVEEGALRRFDPRLAANIALKKIREGAGTRPHRMPPIGFAPQSPRPAALHKEYRSFLREL